MSSKFRGASFSSGNNASLSGGTGFEPSRPISAGKGPIRSAMEGQGFSLKDRMAARRADKEMMKAATQPGTMQPRPSRLDASPTPGLDAQSPSRLDASPTPGLDAQNLAPAPRESFAQADFRTRTEKTLSGAYGDRAKAKTQREMMNTGSRFRNQGMAMLGQRPAMATKTASMKGSAKPIVPPQVSMPMSDNINARMAAENKGGKELANYNMRTLGVQGAAADYFQRSKFRSPSVAQR